MFRYNDALSALTTLGFTIRNRLFVILLAITTMWADVTHRCSILYELLLKAADQKLTVLFGSDE